MTSGCVFNVQRFSVHDGPGIRTTIFLKGCPLRCRWCDNPESQSPQPQIVFWKARCIGCQACLAVCPRSAIVVDETSAKRALDDRCNRCGRCLEECYAGALEQIGRAMSVDQLLALVEEDRPFYVQSGGGVTLSGGEPTLQSEFSQGVLEGCHARGIHTAIETCGFAPWTSFERLLPFLDLILYDVKETNSDQHRRATGVGNDLILDNLKRLAQTGKTIIVRRPVIPGWNDSQDSIHALAQFMQQVGNLPEVNLLPYHRFGQGKYERLERDYPMGNTPSLQEDQLTRLREILLSYGFRVKIGG